MNAPSIISAAAPAREIHLRNSGALLRSQPVTPPNTKRGEIVVPNPNRIANVMVAAGLEKGSA